MLDEIHIDNSRNITKNSYPAGYISRTNDKSFFETFHYNSNFAKKVLSVNPTKTIKREGYTSCCDEKPIKILQMLLIGDGYILAEIIFVE